MSLKNKMRRVMQMGFQLGVASTTVSFNGATYDKDDFSAQTWEKRYEQEFAAALEEFVKYAESNRL